VLIVCGHQNASAAATHARAHRRPGHGDAGGAVVGGFAGGPGGQLLDAVADGGALLVLDPGQQRAIPYTHELCEPIQRVPVVAVVRDDLVGAVARLQHATTRRQHQRLHAAREIERLPIHLDGLSKEARAQSLLICAGAECKPTSEIHQYDGRSGDESIDWMPRSLSPDEEHGRPADDCQTAEQNRERLHHRRVAQWLRRLPLEVVSVELLANGGREHLLQLHPLLKFHRRAGQERHVG